MALNRKHQMSLGKKLILTSLFLVLLPMLAVGTIAFGSLKKFGSSVAEQSARPGRRRWQFWPRSKRSQQCDGICHPHGNDGKLAQLSAGRFLSSQTGQPPFGTRWPAKGQAP
jgi:hypothetical protein